MTSRTENSHWKWLMIPEQNDDGFLIDNNILLNCELFFFYYL